MTTVIDVHGHIFSGRDIPIKGYLLSRKRKALMERLLGWALVPVIAQCARKERAARTTACNVVLNLVSRLMGGQYQAWAKSLSKEVVDIVGEMVRTYPRIDLFVPLMIDYEYWFHNSPDTDIKEQIQYIYKQVVLPGKGRIHPFAPFDPARELAHRKGLDCPDGGPEKHSSLALVRDAIENKGFIGVKVYNSMGYKPFNNAEVDEKRRQISLHREKGYADALTGQEYDEVLCELYDYCVENEIPITAHCVMDGIESYPGASFDFCKATFWRDVLDQDRYKGLHVNLAHFGWSPAYGYDGPQSWVPDICRMVTEYEHLYTDVSHHYVLTTRSRRRFKEDYAKMRADAGDRWPKLKEKILFGIDWHVIKRARNFERFQEAYATVLKEGASYTSDDMDQFLSGNAMRFLGLEQGCKNRQRLAKFYQDQGIDPPTWFQ